MRNTEVFLPLGIIQDSFPPILITEVFRDQRDFSLYTRFSGGFVGLRGNEEDQVEQLECFVHVDRYN